MASISHPANLCGPVDRPASVASRGILLRALRRLTGVFPALAPSHTDREVARLLGSSGGRFTDSMEREIMRKVLVSNWSLPD